MCSLSFIPRKKGYLLAMNRDERLTRETGLPPKVFDLNGSRAIFPYEGSGGTWIGANDRGIALALLNQNLEGGDAQKTKSRGIVVRHLLSATSLAELDNSLARLELTGTLPFRLVAFVPRERAVVGWKWNASALESKTYPWKQGHWFSSGLGDEMANRERGTVCTAAWKQARSGTILWLRQLHRSHLPQRGAFSLCVHRDDAQSVSYTEILCGAHLLELRYRPGPPCEDAKTHSAKLPLMTLQKA